MKARRLVSTLRGVIGTSDDGPYECRECEARFSVRHHSCPECGSYRIERRVWLSQ